MDRADHRTTYWLTHNTHSYKCKCVKRRKMCIAMHNADRQCESSQIARLRFWACCACDVKHSCRNQRARLGLGVFLPDGRNGIFHAAQREMPDGRNGLKRQSYVSHFAVLCRLPSGAGTKRRRFCRRARNGIKTTKLNPFGALHTILITILIICHFLPFMPFFGILWPFCAVFVPFWAVFVPFWAVCAVLAGFAAFATSAAGHNARRRKRQRNGREMPFLPFLPLPFFAHGQQDAQPYARRAAGICGQSFLHRNLLCRELVHA